MIGINSENENHRLLVKELVVDGELYEKPVGKRVKIAPIPEEIMDKTAGKAFREACLKINEIIAALSK